MMFADMHGMQASSHTHNMTPFHGPSVCVDLSGLGVAALGLVRPGTTHKSCGLQNTTSFHLKTYYFAWQT